MSMKKSRKNVWKWNKEKQYTHPPDSEKQENRKKKWVKKDRVRSLYSHTTE